MWEKIDDKTERLHVPGGWIVRSCLITGGVNAWLGSVSQVFVPDEEHMWRLPKTEETDEDRGQLHG